MPQGSLKPSGKHAASKSGKQTRSQTKLKHGNRVIKAKRLDAQKEVSVVKRHTTALTESTEKLLAARIGHLEILKGTRRELEKKAKAKAEQTKLRAQRKG